MRLILITLLWFSSTISGYAQSIPNLASLPKQGQLEEVESAPSLVGKYRTETMIGPMIKADRLFPNLKSKADYRTQSFQSFQSAPAVRPEATSSFYAWATPNLGHLPLYFEQPNLERYGIKRFPLLNSPISAGQFYASIAVLPYKLLHRLPNRTVYTLGHHRPGDWTPLQGISSFSVWPKDSNLRKQK